MQQLIPNDRGLEELLRDRTVVERKKAPCADDDDHEFEEALDAVVEDLVQEVWKNGKKVEIHSDKWHRCINKVDTKGGKYNKYAVCTSSIGKAGSFAKGHGGRAKPKGA